MSDFLEKLAPRLKKAIIGSGGYDKIAEKTGVSKNTLVNYTSGRNDPKISILLAIAEACDIDPYELIGVDGRSFAANEDQRFVAIPVMDVEASAGNGSPVEHEGVADLMSLNEVWLRQTFHVTPNSVTILPVKGDSMEPTIRSGELVLIEKIDPSGRPGDGIYIVRLDGSVAVKRLQSLPGGVIRVSSDNKNFTPYDVGPDDTVDFAVLGRVLAGLRAI